MTWLRTAIACAALASLPAACGSSTPASPDVDPETALSEATERTLAEGSAQIHAYSPSKGDPALPEWDTRGDISFAEQEARLTAGDELSIYKPSAIWKTSPSAAFLVPGKKWIRLPRASGPSVIDDRLRLLVYLAAGVIRSAAPNESEIAGVETLHYDTQVEVEQALNAVPEEIRLLAEDALKSSLLGGTGRAEFWVDHEGRLRRIQVTVPPGRVYSYSGPDGSKKRLESVSTIISTLDYSQFGVDVDVTPPPSDEVYDPGAPG